MISSAVTNVSGDSILLSGGLDTSIIAALASSSGSKIHAFTVILKDCLRLPTSDVLQNRRREIWNGSDNSISKSGGH